MLHSRMILKTVSRTILARMMTKSMKRLTACSLNLPNYSLEINSPWNTHNSQLRSHPVLTAFTIITELHHVFLAEDPLKSSRLVCEIV